MYDVCSSNITGNEARRTKAVRLFETMCALQNGNLGNRQKHCEMKTDLNLLLECLKYQMDNPTSQKEALVTICSICQQNSEASDFFRQIGGLMFVNNLAKSSMEGMVKEAALFTLGVLAESNVFCQQTLCTSELFEDIILSLSNEDSSMTLKRMSVYVILVMVSNNKTGQSLARETGCINILLQLFRTLSLSEMNISDENINQCYQLWSSVCSALCACANNPQNDDNQKTCCLVFPYAKDRLQKCTRTEFVRPICSLVGLAVANNSYAQDYFVSVGGLDTMAEILVKLVEDSYGSYSSAKLAVVVTKTLDACIADNPTASVVLSKHNTVSNLLALLSSTSLNPGDRFSIVLTLGHCTEDCEENQCDLLKSSGLPLIIQVLTESHDEEMSKAATFVLQNCRQINTLLDEVQIKERNLGDRWKKAKEILQRIEVLENQLNEGCKGDACVSATIQPNHKILQHVNSANRNGELPKMLHPTTELETGEHSMKERTTCGPVLQASEEIPTYPAPVRRNMKENVLIADPIMLCSDIIDKEIHNILETSTSGTVPDSRCSDIQLTPIRKEGVNYKAVLKNKSNSQQNLQSIILTPMKKVFASTPKIASKRNKDITEKSACSGVHSKNIQTEEIENAHDVKLKTLNEKHIYSCNEHKSYDVPSSSVCIREFIKKKRRIRKEFTKEEINYLEDGVKKLGHHWNSILWSYPFQEGRTNVDLARKYQKLQRNENKNQTLRGSSVKNLDPED
ncbi:telomere repeats-binding bouquet formation protein 1 isoform X3 [Microcaecilia unicolor]|uniref:Telomere repeats-binding bouquet formation protein 1 isoform X3 n=1 Tax=Microcaecilia unicolor TaxID=1415580 RepID=A0A6P7Y5S4_9AMPH|nr:telomere repeats-binding bouquet formation protein 1 isoform X3 [Microcaecilia unicolor]